MRLLTYPQLKPEKGINYCRTHLARLEDADPPLPAAPAAGGGGGRTAGSNREIDEGGLANLAAGKLPPQGAPASTCKGCGKRFERWRSAGHPSAAPVVPV